MIYDKCTSRHAMRRSLLWVSSSIGITLGIVVLANLISPSPAVANFSANLLNFDVLPSYNWDADTAAEVGLTVEVPEQSDTLSYSSQAEVFRFTLQSDGPFTLRYLTLAVSGQGLKPVTGWTVYPLKNKQADFANPVGSAQSYADGLLRLRFSSSASAAYIVDPGEHTFVLVASVLKDPVSTVSPELSIGFAENLLKEWDWAWLPGKHTEAWLEVQNALGSDSVGGLPEHTIRRR